MLQATSIVTAAVILQITRMGCSFAFSDPQRVPRRKRSELGHSILLDIDAATELSQGSFSFPPMVSVPCTTSSNGHEPVLREIVKPPNVEALYDWYCHQTKTPDSDPSWGILWPTAVSLTNYLLKHSDNITQKTVVELGAGLGLCGLAAAALGAETVTLTDREPYALHCALASAACNDLSSNVVKGAILDWSNPVLPTRDNTNGSCDVILASDVLYDGETILAFANACETLIDSSKGGILLLSDPREERFPTAREMLKEALVSCGNEHRRYIDFEIVDLPEIVSTATTSSTMDGRDHEERMKEPTVLIRCTFGPRETL